jgi:2,4-dienoyl-CoA reductase-like NADH-dependent reductase (Old Yellow Enzyme family)
MSQLFQPWQIGTLQLANRIVIAPMCQYSANEGTASDWHMIHLGQLALSGAGLLTVEATAVSPEGRISPTDLGLYSDANEQGLARVLSAIRAYSPIKVAIQLAHAGRKGSSQSPWHGGKQIHPDQPDGWHAEAPSAVPHAPGEAPPLALDAAGLKRVRDAFAEAARRSARLGFDGIEVHTAHGYLLHEFLSPLCNQRDDDWGGSLANRARLLRSVVGAVRDAWPRPRPLFVRVSATDWTPGGWDIGECVELARWLKQDGVDLIDCSSGGAVPHAKVPVAPGYQVPFAERIRREAGIATGAVGLITHARQANAIVERGDADLVLLARESLRDPYFARRAAAELGVKIDPPQQYARAW